MKRINHLYHQICSRENVLQAYKKASRGKSHYQEVKDFRMDIPGNVDIICRGLEEKTFRNSEYEKFTTACSGKRRLIYKLPFMPDRVVQHAICQILEPLWNRQYIRDTYACIKGRGIHDGVLRVQQALKDDPAGTTYCLKLDIHKYFPSIDNSILKQLIRRKIKCKDTLWLLDEIIDSERGLPIGNYLSQNLSNIYLSGLDHYIKEQLHVRYYYRYCDDLVLLSGSKDRLRDVFSLIKEYLAGQLNLIVKPNWQIFPVSKRGIDFLGYRFFHGYTLLRKSIVKKMKRRVREIKNHAAPRYSLSVRSTLASYHGWMKYANAHNLEQSLFRSNEQLPQIF